MSEEATNIFVIVIGLPLFGIAIYIGVMDIRHMIKMHNNFKPNIFWGRFIPFCVFFPHLFTEVGNMHRRLHLKYIGLFTALIVVQFVAIYLWRIFLN